MPRRCSIFSMIKQVNINSSQSKCFTFIAIIKQTKLGIKSEEVEKKEEEEVAKEESDSK